ncbi:MAG: hypothetical protein NVSMB62_13690 [Acidobacteriaceae bacterium]
MNSKNRTWLLAASTLLLTIVLAPFTAQAQQTWRALLGAQNKDMGKQAIAFLPNELWIHSGDSIIWTSGSGDIHSVSFFVAGQKYQNFRAGCPGYTPSGSSFDGTKCVSAPPLVTGQNYTVRFPVVGNFKLICLVHPHMTGVIHVLPTAAPLPHNQMFYDELAEKQAHSILSDTDSQKHHMEMAEGDSDDMFSTRVLRGKSVIAGIGEIGSTAAGFQSLSIVRFIKGNIEVRVGDTVEFTNLDPALPHTVTFGKEPGNPFPPTANVTLQADGSLHATINSTSDSVHSGFLGAAPEDQVGVPQAPPATTVFRVTFTHAGTYNYICALHDNLGMVGKVVVLP